ncbi:MAG TPA: MBL fold metallo-hydrolase, partial [Alphaproteobacteria bacterium]|nr:MBL fold metallo-hydrolase [Alphaproteobacteria bacterium]
MKLSFHGADRGVTGSCHMIECAGKRILIDCGLYQGNRELDEENAEPFGFEPSDIDYVLLTHAHLDHCGRLPLLAKRGFKGEIITTAASRDLARLVLLDAARLNEEETSYRNRKARARGADRLETKPLYEVTDALDALSRFGRTADYQKPIELARGIQCTFFDAGHILGSASIRLDLAEAGRSVTVLFSGDIGNSGRALMRDPSPPSGNDGVVMECTYGDRLHRPMHLSIEELYDAVTSTFERGGNVIIPTFALERAQEILAVLKEGIARGRLSRSMQVFLDSPMAISATEIFKRHPECFASETRALFGAGQDPFSFPGLHFIRETEDSKALNRISGGAVIMAGSGMCTGGRVRHHLRNNLSRDAASIVFVGFAARGTLARQIIDGAKSVTIF